MRSIECMHGYACRCTGGIKLCEGGGEGKGGGGGRGEGVAANIQNHNP